MRYRTTTLALAIPVAFAAGIASSPLTRYSLPAAHAETAPPLAPAVIDLMALKHGDLPTTANPEMNSRMLVVTDNATLQIQSGNVAKHIHPKTDEIQYIIEGSGAMWLGGTRRLIEA